MYVTAILTVWHICGLHRNGQCCGLVAPYNLDYCYFYALVLYSQGLRS